MFSVLDRITYFRALKGWSEYQLAEHSGLTQSTISSWYRKNQLPTIPSLEKICLAFDITLSQFFATDTESFELTPTQQSFVIELSRLSVVQQESLLNFIKSL